MNSENRHRSWLVNGEKTWSGSHMAMLALWWKGEKKKKEGGVKKRARHPSRVSPVSKLEKFGLADLALRRNLTQGGGKRKPLPGYRPTILVWSDEDSFKPRRPPNHHRCGYRKGKEREAEPPSSA